LILPGADVAVKSGPAGESEKRNMACKSDQIYVFNVQEFRSERVIHVYVKQIDLIITVHTAELDARDSPGVITDAMDELAIRIRSAADRVGVPAEFPARHGDLAAEFIIVVRNDS
jgi:hypothetical protein